MGSTQAAPKVQIPALSKHVVMIGFSYGGQQIVQHLKDMDEMDICHFTVVDKSDHFEHQPNQFEAFTDPEVFTKTNCLSFDIMAATYNKITNGRFTFKRAKLTHVLHKENKIEVELPDGSARELIDYDVLCISTGANYCAPWRPDDFVCDTLKGRDEEFAEVRAAMKETPSILCIGAGETGLETAGWMKEAYPEKVIGVCMRGDTILRGVDGAHKVAEKHLKEMDINIHYHYTHSHGQKLKYSQTGEYDYYLDCTGLKFTGPTDFFKSQLDVLDKKTNQILVDKEGRVTNVHPIATVLKRTSVAQQKLDLSQQKVADSVVPLSRNQEIQKNGDDVATACQDQSNDKMDTATVGDVVLKNVFCIGDVCLTPSNETKSVVSMYQYTPVVAHNMLQVLLGRQPDWTIPKEFTNLQMCPIGAKRGISIFNNFVQENNTCWQFKLDIRDMQIGSLRNEKKYVDIAAQSAYRMPKIFALASSPNCTCLPIHVSKSRANNEKVLEKAKKEYDSLYNQM